MQLRKNRRVETAAVNATRAFFEEHDCVFQAVDGGNDYGKDAYVDLTEDRRLTGTCIAVQIKGGDSYRRADGYAIPIEGHLAVWRDSSLPVAGIVFDPSDGLLRWVSITGHLATPGEDEPSSIPVPKENVLTTDGLATSFRPTFERESRRTSAGNCILSVCSDSPERRFSAITECFAHGRSDARVLIALRYMLKTFDARDLDRAIIVLTHATPHPDIFWTKDNWIPEDVSRAVCSHFRWTPHEVLHLLTAVGPEQWRRGGMGQHVYMLLHDDPAVRESIDRVVALGLEAGLDEAAWDALYLAVYWAGSNGRRRLQDIAADQPEVRRLPLFGELTSLLAEQPFVSLFE